MKANDAYGVDIAIRRMDDLDRKVIEEVKSRIKVPHEVLNDCCDAQLSVLDIGCGEGGLSVKLAQAGATVTGVDVGECGSEFAKQRLEYVQGDMRELPMLLNERKFDICVIQRALHYVAYSDAVILLRDLRNRISHRLYISVTGLESDIGRNYLDKTKPIEERFCKLSDTDAEIFSINQKVCLYTPEEFIDLLKESDWKIEEYWVSAFGNVKAVCSNLPRH